LDLVEAQFLLDHLNSTESEGEQSAILDLMCQIKAPLPIDALMVILEDRETSTVFLRQGVAHTLAVVQAEDALDLFLSVLMNHNEDAWLREMMTDDLAIWKERIPNEILLTLLADSELGVVTSALSVLREWPPDALPLERVLSYCTHEEGYVRKAAIKALLAASLRIPPGPILSALHDPEQEVRAAASHGCISLLEW